MGWFAVYSYSKVFEPESNKDSEKAPKSGEVLHEKGEVCKLSICTADVNRYLTKIGKYHFEYTGDYRDIKNDEWIDTGELIEYSGTKDVWKGVKAHILKLVIDSAYEAGTVCALPVWDCVEHLLPKLPHHFEYAGRFAPLFADECVWCVDHYDGTINYFYNIEESLEFLNLVIDGAVSDYKPGDVFDSDWEYVGEKRIPKKGEHYKSFRYNYILRATRDNETAVTYDKGFREILRPRSGNNFKAGDIVALKYKSDALREVISVDGDIVWCVTAKGSKVHDRFGYYRHATEKECGRFYDDKYTVHLGGNVSVRAFNKDGVITLMFREGGGKLFELSGDQSYIAALCKYANINVCEGTPVYPLPRT
jgi:hypothetical protein